MIKWFLLDDKSVKMKQNNVFKKVVKIELNLKGFFLKKCEFIENVNL